MEVHQDYQTPALLTEEVRGDMLHQVRMMWKNILSLLSEWLCIIAGGAAVEEERICGAGKLISLLDVLQEFYFRLALTWSLNIH